MTPIPLVPSSTRFAGWVSTASLRRRHRSSSATRRGRALAGIMTYLRGLCRSSGWRRTGVGAASSTSTTPLEWDRRVVVRRNTGVSNSSDSSKAARVNSRASAESAGSNMGSFAATA